MNKIAPITRIDFKSLKIGDTINIHADRLASFKTTVWRYNKNNMVKYYFNYSPSIDNYVIATRKKYISHLTK